jgi:DNA-3-methyladenine glycosylase I
MKIVVSALLLPLTRHCPAASRTVLMSSSALPEKTYCFVAQGHEWHGPYHDNEYGVPIRNDDSILFERLLLEINQAGLSWLTILKKREGFREAYANFDIDAIANYDPDDEERLRGDANIIRNKLKIKAAIHNAQVIKGHQKSHGSFQAWLDHNHPLSKSDWVKLFKKHFKFTGGEITTEFLRSLGYLPGAHHPNCIVYKKIKNAPWMSVVEDFEWD